MILLESGHYPTYVFPAMRCAYAGLGRSVLRLVILTGLVLVGGCTTFNHDWAKAGRADLPAPGLLGRWEGNWLSGVNGHNGSLRCVVTSQKDGAYKARFHAIYRKVIGFGYTVPLKVTETNGVFVFSGQANLGWWAGGVYTYAGQAEGTNFFSTYRCKYDQGTFQMNRLP